MALIDRGLDSLLRATLLHLRPYLDDIVVIGGVANALLRHHPLAASTDIPVLGTTDIDLATLERISRKGRPPLTDLLRDAGVAPTYQPEHSPPVIKFVGKADPNLEIEFLCPLKGSEYRRSGKRQVAASIQEDVTAQQLRYLDLLLFEPWSLDAHQVPVLKSLPTRTVVRLPNPASFVMQKVLIRSQGRSPAHCEKDCGYIYETAVTFRDAVPELSALASRLKNHVSKSWWQRFDRDFRALFGGPDAPGPVAATRQHNAARSGRAGTARVTEAMVYQSVDKLAVALLGPRRLASGKGT